jgi:hypothetical protein
MEQFIMGAIAMASLIAALFFLRFWRETGDRLFAMFALAFLLLGITRLGLAASQDQKALRAEPPAVAEDKGLDKPAQLSEGETSWYWARLAAFVLILVAIVDKNRR